MRNRLKITFVLPFGCPLPCGGPKVIYEYANHLARRGHSVTVVHPALLGAKLTLLKRAKAAIRYVQRSIDRSYRPDQWFHVDPSVRVMWVPSLAEQHIPDADVIVASWWQTAEVVNGYSSAKGRHFYLLQGLETWDGNEERVYSTWKMPFTKIVIAHWLGDIADGLNESSVLIQNGLDFSKFGMDTPPAMRNSSQCMMLHHPYNLKGTADGLQALSLVKQQIPSLRVLCFGVSAPPASLPDWIEYRRNPQQTTLRNLYNQASIFIAPSWCEGWGLTASEAMMCGAAVVATDIGGHREFAFHEHTALLSPPKDPRLLAANILRLLRDSELRVNLAERGHQYIQQFTWDRAVEQLETVLLQGE
jgi:glycosyltransferase involved in cell wall biosynthesis